MAVYLDGHQTAEERSAMEKHAAGCGACRDRVRSTDHVRQALKTLPRMKAPAELTTALRVVASRELLRHQTRSTWAGRRRLWTENLRLWINNLMRPLAIPTAGGVISAILLFSVLAPTLYVPVVSANDDIPLSLYTEAEVKHIAPVSIQSEHLIEVVITVDEEGRMVDYSVPNCPSFKNSPLRSSLASSLLLSQFTPATTFGRPMAGKIRMYFRGSHINVKG